MRRKREDCFFHLAYKDVNAAFSTSAIYLCQAIIADIFQSAETNFSRDDESVSAQSVHGLRDGFRVEVTFFAHYSKLCAKCPFVERRGVACVDVGT